MTTCCLDPPDVVIAMVNAATLERNLYLVAELLALPVPVVVGLNMLDVAEAHGLNVEAQVLEAALGLPVVELVASKGRGLDELVEAAVRPGRVGARGVQAPSRPSVRAKHQPVLAEIEGLVAGRAPARLSGRLGGAQAARGRRRRHQARRRESVGETWDAITCHPGEARRRLRRHRRWPVRLDSAHGPRGGGTAAPRGHGDHRPHRPSGDSSLLGACGAGGDAGGAVWRHLLGGGSGIARPERLITGDLAALVRDWLSGAPQWLSGLLVDGIIGGAGTVISFMPILVVFFAALGSARGRGLHGAHRLRDGPLHALDGAARQVLHAPACWASAATSRPYWARA